MGTSEEGKLEKEKEKEKDATFLLKRKKGTLFERREKREEKKGQSVIASCIRVPD